jgi:hypothetical protein
MKTIGAIMDGVQSTTQGEAELRAGGATVSKADSSGMTGYVDSTNTGIYRNPSTINQAVTISANEQAVAAGPLTIGSSGTLTVSGVLVIV